MRITTNLLKQLGNIPESIDEIVRLIQEHIGEIDYHYNLEEDYKDIVVAEITNKEEHPDAEKLSVYQVNYGGSEDIQVVAGDKKLNIGDKVAYLKVGSKVPNSIHTEAKPLTITAVNLRGITSNGMLGSEKELNIGDDHENVLVLPKDSPVGEEFAKYYDMNDTVIEIENKALTNRGDLFGVLGIARELTAITGNKFVSPDWYLSKTANLKPEDNCLKLEIINNAEALCPRYVGITLDDIHIEESPVWLKSVLTKCDIKPINNIVDITNYISLIVGQPLHAFDYDKLVKEDPREHSNAYIKIRMAKQGEKILGLDDKIYELDEKVMVIADSTHPIAIAGIIGGKDTEVDENTKRIILESANFDKSSIRRSSMKLGVFTDAATKFKHSLDPEQCLPALLKAVDMVKELGKGKISSEVIDIYIKKFEQKTIKISIDDTNSVLGTELDIDPVKKLLENLEYSVKKDDVLYVTPPSWRRDIEIKEDVYEDIGRIYGFSNIKQLLPSKVIAPPATNKTLLTKLLVREVLSNSGAFETINYSFVNQESFSKCNLDSNISYKIKNSLSPELSFMRTSLLQSLLQRAQENLERGINMFTLYEIGIPHLLNFIGEDKLPIEKGHVSLLSIKSKKEDVSSSPYYLAKKYLERIFDKLNLLNVSYNLIADSQELDLPPHIKNSLNLFEPNSSAITSFQGINLGIVGEIKNSIKDNFKLPDFTCGFDIDLDVLSTLETEQRRYRKTSVYPSFTHDLCFEVDLNSKYIDIKNRIESLVNSDLLWGRVECLDIYKGENVPEDSKRITFRINVSNYNKTLNEEEIKSIVNQITDSLKKEYQAELV